MTLFKKNKKDRVDIYYKASIAYMAIFAITWILLTTPIILGTSIASATTTTEDDSPTTPTTPTEEPEQEPSPAEPPAAEITITEEPTTPTTEEPTTPTTEEPSPAEPLGITGTIGANQTVNQTVAANQTVNATLQNTPENRQLAATTGEIYDQVAAGLENLNEEAHGNVTRAAELSLQNLVQRNALTPQESQQMETIIQLLNSNQTDTTDLINKLSSIHNQLMEQNASPLAIAISDIAQSSAEYWSNKTADNGQGGVEFRITPQCTSASAALFGLMAGYAIGTSNIRATATGLAAGAAAGALAGCLH